MPTDRWSEADRELVAALLAAHYAGDDRQPHPPVQEWDREAAEALLDALTAADWVRLDPDEPHLVEFREDGWTIQHPVRCRPNLFACPVNRVAGRQIDGPPASGLGVYECDVDGDGVFVLDYSSRRPSGSDDA